jgi:PncC family amidohydrolase
MNNITKHTELPEYVIGDWLREKHYQLATAESCTGGLIGSRITDVPGSSDYYLGGVISYAYEAKETLLGVNHQTLIEHGAVSRQTVIEMADGVRKVLSADLGISVSGIAGPGGGMPGKPVGLVWIGLSTPDGTWAYRNFFTGSRTENRESAAGRALELALHYLQGNPDETD